MTEINPEQLEEVEDEPTPEELAELQAMFNEQASGEEDGPMTYADSLDIIGQYEIEIYKNKKEMHKLEAKVEMLKMDIELGVEKEWIEKKTPELSNQPLRKIATAKKINENEEIKNLEAAIESYQDTIAVQTAYMKNEERAFKLLLAMTRMQQPDMQPEQPEQPAAEPEA